MTLLNKRYNGIIPGWFPGRYTRPKTGIFSWSQYELSSLQNFVLRHIGGIAPLRSRDCPISRHPLTFTHGEISQKFFAKILASYFFAKFSQVARISPAEFAPFRRNPQNPPKPRICYLPQKFFQKIFSKKIPKILRPSGACVENALYVGSREIFRKNFFQIFFGILYKVSTPRQLDREDFLTLRFHYD